MAARLQKRPIVWFREMEWKLVGRLRERVLIDGMGNEGCATMYIYTGRRRETTGMGEVKSRVCRGTILLASTA